MTESTNKILRSFRLLDGETSHQEARAIELLLKESRDFAQQHALNEALDQQLRSRSEQQRLPQNELDNMVASICQRTANEVPRRETSVSWISCLCAALILVGSACATWMLRPDIDLTQPVTAMAMATIAALGLLMSITLPLIMRPDSRWAQRYLNRRIAIGSNQVLLLRAIGIAIVLSSLIASA